LVGVTHEIVRVGGFSSEALTVALGYPLYFALRRRFRLDNIGGLWFDLVLLLPAAAWFAHDGRLDLALLSRQPSLLWMIPLLGLISAVALIAYILSSRRLPFGLFGLLGYVEPVLLVLVALLLGETLPPAALPTYVPIWLAVGFLAVEGAIHLRRRRTGGEA
jgi:chloramphenicol-sensitive protein RarD